MKLALPAPVSFKKMVHSSQFFVWALLIVLIVGGSIISPLFLRPLNLRNVFLIQPVGFGVACMAQLVVILAGGIDLSMGSVVSLISTVIAGTYHANPETPIIAVVAIALGIGITTGLINGFVTTYLRVTPFIATFATGSIYQGIALFYSKRTIGGVPRSYRFIAEGRIVGVPVSIILFVVVAIALAVFLRRHRLGRHLFAVGEDSFVSNLTGIAVDRVKFFSYVLGGALVAMASMYLAARLGGGGPLVGQGYELDSITANVIGGVALAGGTGTIAGVIGGILVITVFSNLMNLMNLNGYLQTFLKGLILVIAVLLNARRKG